MFIGIKLFNFNSHAHVERDSNGKTYAVCKQDFNSHAHVERDLLIYYPLLFVIISTHTLTWSVTPIAYLRKSLSINFNSHAHVERDNMGPLNILSTLHFNSHAHVERDFHFYLPLFLPHYFNSHAHVERDGIISSSYLLI